jgi:hypothetical protein
MGKKDGPAWWKMFAHQRAAIESISNEAVGLGVKAAFRYFDGEEIPEEVKPGSSAFTVFCVIRPYIDESISDYEKSVIYGKRGANERWKR